MSSNNIYVIPCKRTTTNVKLSPKDFPLYNKFYELSKDKFFNLVHNLKPEIIDYIPRQIKYKNSIEKYINRYVFIKENWESNEELNNTTDYFTEIIRIQCSFMDSISPFKYWVGNYERLKFDSSCQTNFTQIKKIRDIMYHNVKFCNNFRISVALTILKLFNVKKWLDISAGWGDRLLAAIGHGVETYVGVDPNTDLHEHYEHMIKMLVEPDKQKNFILINDGFEFANIPKNNYDFVFSSPPFFDLEKYSNSEKDSIIAHPTIDKWYNDFLIVSLQKAYDNLITGGHMVLYIGDSLNASYIDQMIHFLDSIMKPKGSIYYFYENANVPRRMYVWKKT